MDRVVQPLRDEVERLRARVEGLEGQNQQLAAAVAAKADASQVPAMQTFQQLTATVAAKADANHVPTIQVFQQLVAEVASRADMNRVPTEEQLQIMTLWTPIEGVGFACQKQGGHFELPSSVPAGASAILVNVVMRSGNESPNTWYHMDMWTCHGTWTNRRRICGWHYPGQNAISFNSENFEFAVNGMCGRTIFYTVVDPSSGDNWHGLEAQVLGYRLRDARAAL